MASFRKEWGELCINSIITWICECHVEAGYIYLQYKLTQVNDARCNYYIFNGKG